nr:retrovirus-related Pol polyprotein from transposon TNT 1-94 [Tanacetum cinerariifolium]
MAYKLELLDKLHGIHDTFHVSNLKRCFVNDDVVTPLDEVQLDDKLHFVEEPVEIMDRESLPGNVRTSLGASILISLQEDAWQGKASTGMSLPKGGKAAKYALEILKKHDMNKCDSVGTPMVTKPKLDADLSGKLVDQTDYHSKIRSLMYLASSRLDIVKAVCYCARYQARPPEKHLKEVKRIFRYFRGTINMGL